MNKVYIVAARRTAIGAFGSAFKNTPASELGAEVIKAVVADSGVKPEQLDEVIVGNVLSCGQGMGPARQAAIKAGVPVEIPAYSLNMICGSGMKAVMEASAHIRAGDAGLVVAAGMENMSMAPYYVQGNARFGIKMGHAAFTDSIISEGLTDVFNQYHMGITAENIAEKFNISREEQDQFALISQQRAASAIEAGRFKNEIVPVSIKNRKATITIDTDEHPRPDSSLEKMANLRPAFKKDGTVTAANASGVNDGAAALLLASESAVKQYGLQPIAEIVSYGQGGVDPSVMGMGPVPAIGNALNRADMQLSDIDLLELNEAFAAQSLGVINELCHKYEVSPETLTEKTNVNGGAIALGHPIGASGARILVTLTHELQQRKGDYGLASLCIGGGMGTAIIIKRCNI